MAEKRQYLSPWNDSYEIKGETYSVVISDDFDGEKGNLDGLCDYETKTIYIKPDLIDSERDSVLLHELFHAVLFELGVHLTSLTEDMEELIVDNIARFITQSFTLAHRKKKAKMRRCSPTRKS